MGACQDCGQKRELLEVAGMMLCPGCIAPPPGVPHVVFFIDHAREKVQSIVVPGSAIDKHGDLRSAAELESL